MRQAVNQHSFAFVVLGLLVLAALSSRALRRFRWLPFVAAAAVAALLFGALRTGAGDVKRTEDVQRALAAGRPVALELYSNY